MKCRPLVPAVTAPSVSLRVLSQLYEGPFLSCGNQLVIILLVFP